MRVAKSNFNYKKFILIPFLLVFICFTNNSGCDLGGDSFGFQGAATCGPNLQDCHGSCISKDETCCHGALWVVNQMSCPAHLPACCPQGGCAPTIDSCPEAICPGPERKPCGIHCINVEKTCCPKGNNTRSCPADEPVCCSDGFSCGATVDICEGIFPLPECESPSMLEDFDNISVEFFGTESVGGVELGNFHMFLLSDGFNCSVEVVPEDINLFNDFLIEGIATFQSVCKIQKYTDLITGEEINLDELGCNSGASLIEDNPESAIPHFTALRLSLNKFNGGTPQSTIEFCLTLFPASSPIGDIVCE